MRIVDRQTFLSLRNPTVYIKIPERWIMDGEFCIKTGTLTNDWFYQSFNTPISDDPSNGLSKCNEMIDQGASYPIDEDDTYRDGCFDDSEMFLVYERDDVNFLIEKLKEANGTH